MRFGRRIVLGQVTKVIASRDGWRVYLTEIQQSEVNSTLLVELMQLSCQRSHKLSLVELVSQETELGQPQTLFRRAIQWGAAIAKTTVIRVGNMPTVEQHRPVKAARQRLVWQNFWRSILLQIVCPAEMPRQFQILELSFPERQKSLKAQRIADFLLPLYFNQQFLVDRLPDLYSVQPLFVQLSVQQERAA